MDVRVIDHPLVSHKLSLLRDKHTPSPVFRQLVEELVMLLAYEATDQVRVEPVQIETPVTTTTSVQLSKPRPIVVPILRAGLGMLEGMARLIPSAEVGFVGMVRDEETLEPFTYAERLPADLSGRQCYVLDPMLATGGALAGTVQVHIKRGADHHTSHSLIAAPPGSARMRRLLDQVQVPCTLVVAAVDEHLNEVGYIVPGLGDAGDRLYGLAE